MNAVETVEHTRYEYEYSSGDAGYWIVPGHEQQGHDKRATQPEQRQQVRRNRCRHYCRNSPINRCEITISQVAVLVPDRRHLKAIRCAHRFSRAASSGENTLI